MLAKSDFRKRSALKCNRAIGRNQLDAGAMQLQWVKQGDVASSLCECKADDGDKTLDLSKSCCCDTREAKAFYCNCFKKDFNNFLKAASS